MIGLPPQAQQEAAARLAASEAERARTRTYLERGELLKVNSSDRIEKRKVRLLADQSLTPILGQKNRDALASGLVSEAPEEAQRAFEAQIGGRDTQPCWFLTRGTENRRTVGRIHIRDAHRRVGWGTGFLVAPNLLLTNHHVLPSVETARFSRVELDYEETFAGETLPTAIFDLSPDFLFVSHPARTGMDYALVAVNPRARLDSQRPDANLAEFGHNVLVRQEGKLVKGELIYCIHHPEGQPRSVNLRENRLTALDDPALQNLWMHYETDTERGSSGAPLYNYEWVVVGIHHMAIEEPDARGTSWRSVAGAGHRLWASVRSGGMRTKGCASAVSSPMSKSRSKPPWTRTRLRSLSASSPNGGHTYPNHVAPAPNPPSDPLCRPCRAALL